MPDDLYWFIGLCGLLLLFFGGAFYGLRLTGKDYRLRKAKSEAEDKTQKGPEASMVRDMSGGYKSRRLTATAVAIPTSTVASSMPHKNNSDIEKRHLDDASNHVAAIYSALKAGVLEINPDVAFNSVKSYISIYLGKNLAYIQIRKHKLLLTPLIPEAEIQQKIQTYKVRTYSKRGKQSWGGDCACIIMENQKGLREVIDLLRPHIAT